MIMSRDGKTTPMIVYAAAGAGIALQAIILGIATKKGYYKILDFGGFAITILYALALVLLAEGRLPVVVNVFADHVGTIGTPLLIAAVFFLLALMAQIISGFMQLEKE
jgi:hypothetical protein